MVRISLLLIVFVVGCANNTHKFDCKVGTGVGCKSITEVNTMVNKGFGAEKALGDTIAPVKIVASEKNAITRIKEEYLRVWLAPFQDSQGNLHSSSTIYTVLTPGAWQLSEGEHSVSTIG